MGQNNDICVGDHLYGVDPDPKSRVSEEILIASSECQNEVLLSYHAIKELPETKFGEIQPDSRGSV